ncbi:hypothetical protein Tco_0620974, partial [Tanacetum coccineum]
KFLRALHPKWRGKVTAFKGSKYLTSLSLDELIENLKVHEMIIKKDSEIVKAKGERKSLDLKAKKESNDEESSTSKSEDEEYAMEVRDFKKFFKRIELLEYMDVHDNDASESLQPSWGKISKLEYKFQDQENSEDIFSFGSALEDFICVVFVPNRNITFQRIRDDKNGKSVMKCFICRDPNHLIRECSKPPRDKNQKAFIGGSWSDNGEEDDEKAKYETCLMAHASSEVHSKSSYFSDENLSIDDIILDSEYNKLCKMNQKLITKNKHLKAIRNSLENEINELKEKFSKLESNKEVNLECTTCQTLKIDNEKLKEEALKLIQFQKSTHSLNKMLSLLKPSKDKWGLRFNSFEASTSGTKKKEFVKSQNETSSGGGLLIADGGPLSVQMAPKANQEPPDLLDTAYWMEIVLLHNVDQSILYGVYADVDMAYSSKSGNGEFLDMAYWMEIMLLQNVDQSILYSVSADVDTAYSSKSGNGLGLV